MTRKGLSRLVAGTQTVLTADEVEQAADMLDNRLTPA